MIRKLLLGGALLSLLLPACGGAGGKAVQPKDITGTAAMGGNVPMCGADPKYARPLVVDLDPAARVKLEASMQKGVVVVAYDCKSLRVLPACKVSKGNYEYAGVSRKERVIQMKNQDDLSVNLPLSAGKVGGAVSSGNSIDLALVLVGLKSTAIEKIDRAEMTGSCDEATHFLQTASIGAFSMQTGAAGKVSAVADLFKVGASGSSSSSSNNSSSDGSLDACRTSNPDAPAPPTECRSPISVELQPLSGNPIVLAKKAEEDKPTKEEGSKGAAKDSSKDTKPKQDPCPTGFSFSGGICTKDADATHVCKVENAPDCKEQCAKGSFESCYNYAEAKASTLEEAKAAYKKACDGGIGNGCGWYSNYFYDSVNPKAASNKEWIEWARKGCSLGGAEACDLLGDYLWPYQEDDRGPLADQAAAIRAFDRACALGRATGCFSGADFYLKGDGVAKDEKRGLDMLERGCFGGYGSACRPLVEALISSTTMRDDERALRAAKFGCKDFVSECDHLATLAFQMNKEPEGVAMLNSQCDREPIFCEALADAYSQGNGVPKDPAKAKELYKKSCDAGLAYDKESKITNDRAACAKAKGRGKPPGKKPVAKPKKR